MPEYVIKRIGELLNSAKKPLSGSKVLIMGVAYKKDVNDIRESPALEIIRLLKNDGAQVFYFDPYVPQVRIDGAVLKSIAWEPNIFKDKDCVAVITDHSSVDYEEVLANSKIVFDTRNVYKNTAARNLVKL